ncbi:MAG: 50S ribosomal protein L15 [Chloroflexi bacterium]|nr:50S ribosomal protein L15 [Chloroflexota bacterium]
MKLHELRPTEGATKKRKRVGRGLAAGGGKTAGRGTKGQNSRTGGGVHPYFEGGQLPLVRRLPHLRGFKNYARVEFEVVNVGALEEMFEAGAEVSPDSLVAAGLLKSSSAPVKVLGDGELTRALTVKANRFSATARAKITAAGGSVVEV